MDFKVEPETDLELDICSDPEWLEGAQWGQVRPGHPEGAVIAHIAAVLANLDKQPLDQESRSKLRLVALIHDTFKFKVDRSRPRTGDNHHAVLARRFAEKYLTDPDVLEIIELHDEAFNSWAMGERKDHWEKAEERAVRLIERLGSRAPLYMIFYRADNETEGKSQEPLRWFEGLL